jgi:CDP-glycerol glycerophosphotransferase
MLRQNNLPAMFYPIPRSILTLIRSNVVISCNTPWRKKFKYHLSFRAKKVQLWHGVGLKKIGLMVSANAERYNSFIGRLSDAIRGKNYIYDLFVSTSDCYTENLFSKAVRAKNFIEAGYPRNDIFFKEQLDEKDLLEADTESLRKIDEFRNKGFKAVLYAPTWDDPLGNPIKSGLLDLGKLSLLAQKHKLLFVLKFHPAIRCDKEGDLPANIIYYSSLKDIQPLLKVTDVLITDYSSVSMDYLLLDRPIIFFPYNLEKYIESQGGLLFDYGSMSPGPICRSQDQLHEALMHYADGRTDNFAGKRAEVRNLAFKYKDGKSSQRIWNFITREFLERPGKWSD